MDNLGLFFRILIFRLGIFKLDFIKNKNKYKYKNGTHH